MMRIGGLAAMLLLGGCIPPAAQTDAPRLDPPADLLETADAPRGDGALDTRFDEQPVWEMRPIEPNAQASAGGVYRVQPGDTLRAIGERTGAGSEMLARINNLAPPYLLQPGQMLTVPEGRFHRVAAGETGIAIARAYGLRWQDIIDANALSEPFVLRIGQRLLLPIGANPTAIAAPSIEARAAAFALDIDSIITGGEPAIDSKFDVSYGRPAPQRPLPPNVAVIAPASLAGGFVWPAAGRVVQRFGPAGEGAISRGIDIAVAPASEIRAAATGVVAFVGDQVANYGGLILLRHGDGWITAYGRIARAEVTRGQKVERGQTIGSAGSGSAPQLFFQMRKNQVPVDPLKQLPARRPQPAQSP